MMRARLMKPMLTAVLLVFAAGLLTTGGTPARAAAESSCTRPASPGTSTPPGRSGDRAPARSGG